MTRAFRCAIAFLAASLVIGVPALSFAGKSAQDHYDEGIELAARGEEDAALAAFLEAYRSNPQPGNGRLIGTHYTGYDPELQIGRIYASQGRTAEAKKFFDLCAQYGYTEKSQNKKEFQRLRKQVEAALPQVAVATAPPPPVPVAPAPPRPSPPARTTVTAASSAPPPSSPAPSRPPPASSAPLPKVAESHLPVSTPALKAPTARPPTASVRPLRAEASLREALRLYLSGAPRADVSRAVDRARAEGSLRELDRPGALYVVACFYAEEYVRTSDPAALKAARQAYRRLHEVSPRFVPPASLRQPKIERILAQ